MLGVKRTVSKDMKQGAPAELACKRYAQKDDSICELRFREFIVVIMNPPYPLSICAVLVMAACVVQLPILSD